MSNLNNSISLLVEVVRSGAKGFASLFSNDRSMRRSDSEISLSDISAIFPASPDRTFTDNEMDLDAPVMQSSLLPAIQPIVESKSTVISNAQLLAVAIAESEKLPPISAAPRNIEFSGTQTFCDELGHNPEAGVISASYARSGDSITGYYYREQNPNGNEEVQLGDFNKIPDQQRYALTTGAMIQVVNGTVNHYEGNFQVKNPTEQDQADLSLTSGRKILQYPNGDVDIMDGDFDDSRNSFIGRMDRWERTESSEITRSVFLGTAQLIKRENFLCNFSGAWYHADEGRFDADIATTLTDGNFNSGNHGITPDGYWVDHSQKTSIQICPAHAALADLNASFNNDASHASSFLAASLNPTTPAANRQTYLSATAATPYLQPTPIAQELPGGVRIAGEFIDFFSTLASALISGHLNYQQQLSQATRMLQEQSKAQQAIITAPAGHDSMLDAQLAAAHYDALSPQKPLQTITAELGAWSNAHETAYNFLVDGDKNSVALRSQEFYNKEESITFINSLLENKGKHLQLAITAAKQLGVPVPSTIQHIIELDARLDADGYANKSGDQWVSYGTI